MEEDEEDEEDKEEEYSELKEEDMERMIYEDEAKILKRVENFVPSTLKKMRKVYRHPRLTVEWNRLVEILLKKLQKSDSSKIVLRFRWKKNLLTFLAKIFEYWTLLTFLFTDDLEWNFEEWTRAALQTAHLEMPLALQVFPYFFFGSLVLCVLYLVLLPSIARKARKGTLGLNPHTLAEANICSCAFFHLGVVKVLSIAMYTGIVVNLLGVFSCDFSESAAPVLHVHPPWECFTPFHIGLMAMALLGLLLYYPAATIVFPNIQYASKAV